MIGNDVIDILQSRKESNWQRKGFIEKIFSPDEQLLISNASNPEIMVWMLWSMKEAAYKIYNRQTKIRAYIPQKLICSVQSKNQNYINGKVICFDNSYYTKTFVSDDGIHTVAVNNLSDFENVIEIEKKSIIKEKNGIPYLNLVNTLHDVSISHHGRFEKVVTIKSK